MTIPEQEKQRIIAKYKKRITRGYPEHFTKLMSTYPNKDSTLKALKYYQKTVRTMDDETAIEIALENYLEHLQNNCWKRCKSTATWFNNWIEWVTWVEPDNQENDPYEAKV